MDPSSATPSVIYPPVVVVDTVDSSVGSAVDGIVYETYIVDSVSGSVD